MASSILSILHERLAQGCYFFLSLYILVYVHVGIDAAVGISGGTIAVEEADLHAKLLSTKLLLAQMAISSLRCIK